MPLSDIDCPSFYRATRMHSTEPRTMPSQDVRLSVRPSVRPSVSVTHRYCVQTVTHILKIFSLSGSPTILVFPHQTGWQYSDGDSPNAGVECKGGIKKITIFDQYIALSRKCYKIEP